MALCVRAIAGGNDTFLCFYLFNFASGGYIAPQVIEGQRDWLGGFILLGFHLDSVTLMVLDTLIRI